MRILLSAYACEPNRGSEPGNGWNWAVHLARDGHEVYVLTTSVGKPSHREGSGFAPVSGMWRHTFISPSWTCQHGPRFLFGGKPSSDTLSGSGWYWTPPANLALRNSFDLVHHVTWGSLRGGSRALAARSAFRVWAYWRRSGSSARFRAGLRGCLEIRVTSFVCHAEADTA